MTAEDTLLHTQFLHLLQDHRSGANVGPEHDSVDSRIFDHLKLVAEIGISRHELLLDHNGMTQPPRSITEFENSEAAVAIVHAQDRNPLQAEFGVDVARQRVALQRGHPEYR